MSKTSDILSIVTGAVLVELLIFVLILIKYITSPPLMAWYKRFHLGAVLADILSASLGVIIARFIASTYFTNISFGIFLLLVIGVQVTHDILFSSLFFAIPRGSSAILDVFKDYGKQVGGMIILYDSIIMIGTVLFASLFASQSLNTNIIVLLLGLYTIPYVLYSI